MHVDHNNFYDNALGFTTDVFTAPGHPGFPQQGDLVEIQQLLLQQLQPLPAEGSDVEPSVPVPVGTGLWIAGGNDDVVRNNHFYDNWRRGTMLFAAPDAAYADPAAWGGQSGRLRPDQVLDLLPQPLLRQRHGRVAGRREGPNGTDFWWDSFPLNTGNCWYRNQAAPGSSVTSSPASLPDCADGTKPSLSLGLGSANEAELLACLATFTAAGYTHGGACSWFDSPAKPNGSAAREAARAASAGMTPSVRRSVCKLFARLPSRVCLGASPRRTG